MLRIWPASHLAEPFAKRLRRSFGLDFDSRGQLWTDDTSPEFGSADRVNQVRQSTHGNSA